MCHLPDGITHLTTYNEFLPPSVCDVHLDLDCNNSSGAEDADFNAPGFHCLSDPVPIADEDISILIDAAISEMTITLVDPLPDDPNEGLIMTAGVPGINASGSNSTMIILSNEGSAKIQDFKDALHLIFYNNTSILPTGGNRIVEVWLTTASGMSSNTASAFIEVIELPLADVNLGPDLEGCEGETLTLDAGNPGATFEWSTGDQTQTITVNQSGQYIVTVSDGVNCPNQDTIEVALLPIINVTLSGDSDICDNEQATLTIETDSPFPLTITIDANPGSPIVFTGITGTYTFNDLPFTTTEYTITEVVPDQPGCIEIADPTQIIEVFPTYIHEQEVSLCDGDSIWLGFYWEKEAGTYENLLESIYGCDSMVTTHITILPAVQIAHQSTTCDPSAAGVFITHLDNPNGCDTVVTTTITLIPSDTTMIALSTCRVSDTGITFDTLTNQQGCDSLIIINTGYLPPTDTTFLFGSTCDSAEIGVMYYTATGADGCDSLVVTTTTFALLDTTYVFATSCDSAQIGVSQDSLTGMDGCDSLVITTTTFALADTTWLDATSCDPAQVGVSQQTLTGQDGCDSMVITTTTFDLADTTYLDATSCNPSQVGVSQQTITGSDGCDSLIITTTMLLPSDAVSLSSTTCDPSSAGVFVTTLTNQHGCDSVVTNTITLLPSDAVSLTGTTCVASEAGVYLTTLTNQHGCDSIITETITLIPGDTTIFYQFTCDPAEAGVSQHATTGSDGCDSMVISVTELFSLPQLVLQSMFDYNGFDISCTNDADGGVMAIITGISPFTYLWSTTDTDAQITGVTAGDYAVTITDENGCTADAVITLLEPTALMMGFEVTEPECFDQSLGMIRINAIGGVSPYTYAKDGGAAQASDEFHALGDGIYQFTVIDANGCTVDEIISIDVPLMISVDLGSDQSISLGDTTDIEAIVNLPFDSIGTIAWSGIDSSGCANCLHQVVAPIITTAYSVMVSSIDGCSDRDTMIVHVTSEKHIYIPNIFSPNGDGVNDALSISLGEDVQEISSFSIFDRWGTLVFGAEHILPNDPTVSWDGRMKGEMMNPGVFAYKLEMRFKDGSAEVRYGDITLLR